MLKKRVIHPKPANGISCEKAEIIMSAENIRLAECHQITTLAAELGQPPLNEAALAVMTKEERCRVIDWLKTQKAVKYN